MGQKPHTKERDEVIQSSLIMGPMERNLMEMGKGFSRQCQPILKGSCFTETGCGGFGTNLPDSLKGVKGCD